jgi:hypothetical protein
MRLLIVNLLAVALVVFSAGFASAYEMRMVPAGSTGTGNDIGDTFTFEIYLDTQVASEVYSFAVGIQFDESLIRYNGGASDGYYPLYTAGAGMVAGTWLVPVADPPSIFVGQSNLLNIEWVSNTWPNIGAETTATATNQYLATVTFEAIGAGSSVLDFSFDAPSNSFFISDGLGGVQDVQGSVAAVGSTAINIVPEPTTALLIGLGLMGLGVAGRNRA